MRLDPETAGYDYEHEYGMDGPEDWWHASRELIVRFVREADGLGLGSLRDDLELLRQRATVQQMLASRDYQRRYIEPRQAEDQRARQPRAPSRAHTTGPGTPKDTRSLVRQ